MKSEATTNLVQLDTISNCIAIEICYWCDLLVHTITSTKSFIRFFGFFTKPKKFQKIISKFGSRKNVEEKVDAVISVPRPLRSDEK